MTAEVVHIVAVAALELVVVVLGQECCNRKLHLDRQQETLQVPRDHNSWVSVGGRLWAEHNSWAAEKGRSWVSVEERLWAELAVVEHCPVGRMVVEKHMWWRDLKVASCQFSEVVLAAAEVDIVRSLPAFALAQGSPQPKLDCYTADTVAEADRTSRLTVVVHMVPEEHFPYSNSQLLQQCSAN